MSNEHPSFYLFASAAAIGGFFFTSIMIFMKILLARTEKERIPRIVVLNVVLIGLLSNVLFVAFNWNGVCIDVLGVTTPATMWGEWISIGPTLVFFTIALTEKKDLNKKDLAIMASFFVSILCGFLLIIPQPQISAYVLVAFSAITCLPVIFLPWYVSNYHEEEDQEDSVADIEEAILLLKDFKQDLIQNQKKPQFYSALWLTIVCCLFPANYLLVATKVIEPEDGVGVFLLLAILIKLFAASMADVHTREFFAALRELELDRQAKQTDLENERLANDSRRAFLKYLFHEVRTPLNSLTLGIELLRSRGGLTEGDVELLTMMTGSADFMTETLNNILSMQKIEEGKMELIFGPFNINNSISKIFSALSGPIVTKNLKLENDVAVDVPNCLLGDVYRVEHIISNLLSNAIKFSPDGGAIRVTVTTQQQQAVVSASSDAANIMVSISDEGPGISVENQAKIFDGFFQVRPDKLQQGKGSGLGLSLCKQIVTLHGGTIGVDSVEGQGSTFRFCVPFGIPTRSSYHLSSKHSPLPLPLREQSISLNDPTVLSDSEFLPAILVVDDVSTNRKMLKAVLNRNGAKNVSTAENGLEAVSEVLANPQKYSIVFMDNLMPVMNGVEATRKLREGGYGNLVIGVTGNILEDDVLEYLSAGADMIMGKPVKVVLLKLLLQYVRESGALSRPEMYLMEDEHAHSLDWRRRKDV